MSPNEAQLRAALHHGEGDSPDAGALISHAVRVRRERQRRITSIVTGTTAVAVVAAGVGLLVSLGNGSDGGANSTSAGGGAALSAPQHAPRAPVAGSSAGKAAGTVPSAAGRFGAAERAPARAVRLACPSAPARYMLPGGGGIGAFGSTEKLFVRTVVAMKVCAYPRLPARTPLSTVLTAADAHQFAAALESAPAKATPDTSCPEANAFVGSQLEVLGVGGDARPLDPVVITVGPCMTSKATNGTAVRYVANLPKPVTKLLDAAAREPGKGSATS